MIVYPLSAAEARAVRWLGRIVPVLAVAVILLLGVAAFG